MVLVGVCHVGLTPLLFPDATSSLVRGGIVDAVRSDPALATLRALPFCLPPRASAWSAWALS